MSRLLLSLVPLGDPDVFQDAVLNAQDGTLRELLQSFPAASLEPLGEAMDKRVSQLRIRVVSITEKTPVYMPPGLQFAPASASASAPASAPAPVSVSVSVSAPVSAGSHPRALSEAQAVEIVYGDEIEQIASFLRAGLSALVVCDKLVVRHLWPRIVSAARLDRVVLEFPSQEAEGGLVPRGLRQIQIARLRELILGLKEGQVLVLPHLDLLVAATERGMTNEAREITELLYEAPDRPLLAFADRTLPVPEVVAARFSVRISLSGLPREVPVEGGASRAPLGVALVTGAERAMFSDFRPTDFFKQVAGLNAVRLRDAIAYAVQIEARRGHGPANPAKVARLYESIRVFKAQTSEEFVIPDVTMDQIGGYDEVKAILARAITLLSGGFSLPDEAIGRELIPRGFLFHGPPGTGKTLFAKAIANQMNATIRVVSGPEVTDMYVGESERKLRSIFAEARRNAPSVVVFDEFDSIAGRRSGRDDGGSRAGNALVAQILTEMDGFRPDVPMLVIGTTNRLNLIDEALLRPSRFQPIAIGLPDEAARHRIAEVHAKHFHVEVSSDLLDVIAEATFGMNGDQIRSIFRDACVGAYCETPPILPTADRLGFLVGRIRAAADDQRLEGAPGITSPLTSGARGASGAGVRRPAGVMVNLLGGRSPGDGSSDGGS